jgi:effector-binding domain-containing protein
MEIKQVDSTMVAMHRFKTRLSKIHEFVGVIPNKVIKELEFQGITITSSQIWSYSECDNICSDGEFNLEICFPVECKGADTDFIQFKELPKIQCVAYLHKGAWSEFGDVYKRLFSELTNEGKVPTGNSREIYLHCNFEDQTKCITEIQIEVN